MDSGHVDPVCEPSVTAGGEPLEPACEPSPCRAREVLQRVGDKWSMYVIDMLGHGTKRFSELHRSVDGITARMLTVTLRGLERDGEGSQAGSSGSPPAVTDGSQTGSTCPESTKIPPQYPIRLLSCPRAAKYLTLQHQVLDSSSIATYY